MDHAYLVADNVYLQLRYRRYAIGIIGTSFRRDMNKTLLITGGTGTFGNAVLQAFLDTGIKEIRIFSRDEKKQDDMRKEYADSKLKFYIGNVRDPSSLRDAMIGVDFVFHAAALKQVPSCEFFPVEAVKTNILGAENVLSATIGQGGKFEPRISRISTNIKE